MAAFDWDTLLDVITQDRSVVPVLGRELLGSAGVSFDERLAARVARDFALPEAPPDLRRTLALALKRQTPLDELARKVATAHRELLPAAQMPEPLRALAAIDDFSLYLSTTPDGLLARALREARDLEPVVKTATVESFDDLPAESSAAPLVYHLFGKVRGLPDFAVTEGDVLEFIHRLHDKELRPPRLFRRLRESHLLLIGQSFPDWLARVFLRLLRDRPVSARGSVFSAMADDCVHAERDATLVLFLRDFCPQTLLYTEGDAAQFSAELHRRWLAYRAPAVPPTPLATPEMKAGAVFISYAHADLAAAEAVAAAVRTAGLNVWFDRAGLQVGEAYAQVIRRNIRQCDLFIPLISAATEARPDGFFRREWEWALARAEGRFICPIVVDDTLPGIYELRGVPAEFLGLHIERASGGLLSGEIVEQIRAAVRELRTARATAA